MSSKQTKFTKINRSFDAETITHRKEKYGVEEGL